MDNNYSYLKTMLVFGCALASLHLAWLIIVYLGYGQKLLDFIFSIHMLNSPYQIQAFSVDKALLLLLISFIIGALYGLIYSLFRNIFRSEPSYED